MGLPTFVVPALRRLAQRWVARPQSCARGSCVSVGVCALALLVLAADCTAAPAAQSRNSAIDAELARLEHEVARLEAARAIKRLQRAWGYYIDRALWNEAGDLFAPDGTIELGADGVYVGRERIREYLRRLGGNRVGIPWGRLSEHYQLQPVVHVSADGRSARARWRDFGLLGQYKERAAWSDGIYENEYVERNGVWMIKSMHLYVNFVAPFEKGWGRLGTPAAATSAQRLNFAGVLEPAGSDWRSAVSREFPPDRPPTAKQARFPESFVPPFHYENPARTHPEPQLDTKRLAALDPRLARYAHQAQLLRDYDEIENLQGIYGYYFDKNLWDELAQLFSDDATFEYGQYGVYVGRQHIRKALGLFGPAGPHRGWLNNAMQLQPVIHVAEDGHTGKGRWESIMQLGWPGSAGAWGLGVYENEYVKERGVWKIRRLHFYVTALADYDRMWDKGAIPMPGESGVVPPDRPPTEIYRSLPGVYIPPFHYLHPVTGKPIVTDPQPADSILRPN